MVVTAGPASHPVKSGTGDGFCVHQVGTKASENKKFNPGIFLKFLSCFLSQSASLNSNKNFITLPVSNFLNAVRCSGIAGSKCRSPDFRTLTGTVMITFL